MTRTIFMGCILEEIKPIYDLVRKNLTLSVGDVKEGANIRNISRAVDNSMEFARFSVMHSLGHGIGLETHESPVIHSKNENTLKENMAITIEPGVYIPGRYGIRIEDTVLVTKNGSEVLTSSDRGYVVI